MCCCSSGARKGTLESGTKYFFLSVLSSGLLLYGFSFLYGSAGSLSLVEIRSALASSGELTGTAAFAPLALVLIFAGLGFRLTAVPFHFYAPDVYQGTTNPNAGLLAVAPKIAALVALVRIAGVAMPGTERLGWQVALALAMITMTLGNVLALWQNNVRRLMAYSSVAHAGYMLIGLAVGFAVSGGAAEATNFDGIGAAFFYMLVYAAATAGTFAALTYLGGDDGELDTVDQLAGLTRNHPKTALAMAIFMFSLTGLPPLAGFWGKFTLFTGALGHRRPHARRKQLVALVPGAGGRRRVECRHLGRLLLADRGRDVFSSGVVRAGGSRRRRRRVGHGRLRGDGGGHWLRAGMVRQPGERRQRGRPLGAGRAHIVPDTTAGNTPRQPVLRRRRPPD